MREDMRDFEAILVGIDLEPRKGAAPGSRTAFQQAKWLAGKSGARLVVLHSTWSDTFSEAVGGSQVVHEGCSDEERTALEELVGEARAEGIDTRLEIVDKRPWLAICRAVLRGEADLVVVGKRNQENGDGRRLGSVAVKLVRYCPSPVWVVKPEHDLVHKLVLAATDLSPVGSRAVRFAAFVAARHDSDLHVVHAYQIPMELQLEAARLSDEEYAERVDEIKRAAQAAIAGTLEGVELSKEPEIHIGRNTPSRAIKEAVEHLHPDLLVMGTISRGGVAGMLVGNTAEKLLDRVDCSILAVKPTDFVSPVELD